jgi:uncharacterized protein (DUF2267 family)
MNGNAEAFDVRVLEFVGASMQTVQGLQQLFGIDAATAQRVIASVPGVLRRRVPAVEAERVAAALTRLGARVMLEPQAGPSPEAPGLPLPAPKHVQPQPPPPPTAAYLHRPDKDVPRPKLRVDAADLEFDVLSALEAAFDTGDPPPPGPALPLPVPVPVPIPSAERPGLSPAPHAQVATSRRMGTPELDLSEGRHDAKLDIDLDHGRTHTMTAQTAQSLPDQLRKRPRSGDTLQAVSVPGKVSGEPLKPKGAEAPMSRAAVVERPAPKAARSRTVPLLQLLAALCVGVMGYWFDSSIAFGNASPLSVIAHGLALQQLLLGIRGLFY